MKNKKGKILGIIPARAGSKGIPGKNKRLLLGKPLVKWSLDAALKSRKINDLVVSTDDSDILKLENEYPGVLFQRRPQDLAMDETPSADVVRYVLETVKKEYSAVCLLQPTSPLRPSGFIDRAIEVYNNSDCDSLVSVGKVPDEFNPHWTFKTGANGFLQIATGEKSVISRRQDLPKAYYRDGSIYITSVPTILLKNQLLGERLTFLVSHPDYIVNIDTEDDWKKAEIKASRLLPE